MIDSTEPQETHIKMYCDGICGESQVDFI